MSKSVDETVFDYFALLLKEPTEDTVEKSPIVQSNLKTQGTVAPKTDASTPLVTKKSAQDIPFNIEAEPSKAIEDSIKSISFEAKGCSYEAGGCA